MNWRTIATQEKDAWNKLQQRSNDSLTLFFTLMPSFAPSCRYGIMEWFHRSMNHERNSSTVTGQDKKKQGPREKEYRSKNNTPNSVLYIYLFNM